MKLLSIDIGIKNLAIIIIETNDNIDKTNISDNSNNNDFKIIKWDVINLCDKNINCSELACKKKPLFFKNNNYYCKIHAKKTNYTACILMVIQ